MLEIKLEFDRSAFDDTTDSFVDGDLQRALIEAVNWTAERVQLAIRASMLTAFDAPVPYTLGGVALYRATPRADGGEPSALVFLLDDVAGFLELEQSGGVPTAGAPGTTRLWALVPGPAAAIDRFGNLPRNYVANAPNEPNVAWVNLRPSKSPSLLLKPPGVPWISSPSSPAKRTRRPSRTSTARPCERLMTLSRAPRSCSIRDAQTWRTASRIGRRRSCRGFRGRGSAAPVVGRRWSGHVPRGSGRRRRRGARRYPNARRRRSSSRSGPRRAPRSRRRAG
jgi:hypothetical protein